MYSVRKKRKTEIGDHVKGILIPILAALIGASATLIATWITIVSSQKTQLKLRTELIEDLENRIRGITETVNDLKRELHGKREDQKEELIKLIGANGWTDTGLELIPGQQLEISAYGSWSIWYEHPEIWPLVGPEGYTKERQIISTKSHWSYEYIHSLLPLPDTTIGLLIGRIGAIYTFPVGEHTRITIKNSGPLFLGCNDWDMNNAGSVVAKITVY
ncbi:MAG: hypothetical protein WCE90_12715 [Candidatus Zixiibacteriota bacterium]